jgi:riboflavin transporter FmnP
MNNLFIAFVLAMALAAVIVVTTMLLVDLFFGQPLYLKLCKKYNELIERVFHHDIR